MTWVPIVLSAWLLVGGAALAWRYRYVLNTFWREPVLRRPVLIIESDDWGPGDASHALQLQRLAQLLARHKDAAGRPAVMTLGVVLAVPDTAALRARPDSYCRSTLAAPPFEAVRKALLEGEAAGTFSLQLHGLEHYWPGAVMAVAKRDPEIRSWLSQDSVPATEQLPPALQSRWIDGSSLPSRSLPAEEVRSAARAEVDEFTAIFGRRPVVAVPPTFIWNDAAEQGWADAGVQVVVTPGRRYETRDAEGRPAGAGAPIGNGQRSTAGPIYIVRDRYFEPGRGHRAEQALQALDEQTRCGRPTLVETHRANFTAEAASAAGSFVELTRLLTEALRRYPDMIFLSTAELAQAIAAKANDLIEQRFAPRLHAFVQRLQAVPSFQRDVRWLGLSWLVDLVSVLTRATSRPASGSLSAGRP